jgi:hypothetical protein
MRGRVRRSLHVIFENSARLRWTMRISSAERVGESQIYFGWLTAENLVMSGFPSTSHCGNQCSPSSMPLTPASILFLSSSFVFALTSPQGMWDAQICSDCVYSQEPDCSADSTRATNAETSSESMPPIISQGLRFRRSRASTNDSWH